MMTEGIARGSMSNRPKIKRKPIKDSERIDWGNLKQAQADDERIVVGITDLLDAMPDTFPSWGVKSAAALTIPEEQFEAFLNHRVEDGPGPDPPSPPPLPEPPERG